MKLKRPSKQKKSRYLPDNVESVYPVEYKKGRRRKFDNDDAQLCAQALCLEEMFGLDIPKGAIFHAKSKRRREVEFTEDLRRLTEQAIEAMHRLIEEEVVPKPSTSLNVPSVHFLTIAFPKSPVSRLRWRGPIGQCSIPRTRCRAKSPLA